MAIGLRGDPPQPHPTPIFWGGPFWAREGPGTLHLSSGSPWHPHPSPKFPFWLIFGPKRATPVFLDIFIMFLYAETCPLGPISLLRPY